MTAARGHVTAAEQTPKPLLLTAADGPWNWPATHYELIAGAPSDLHVTTVCSAVLRDMHSLGVLTATAEGGDGATAYCFEGDEPLRLASTSFDKAGVGHRVWSSALALALFSRSKAAPTLPANPSVLEIGAGVGLPGLHFGQRMKGQARVTLTDSRPALLALLRQNVARLQLGRDAASDGPAGWMEVRRLEWGSGGRLRDGVFFQENSEGSADRNDTHPPDCASGSPRDRDSAEREGGSRREGAAHYDLVLGSDVCYLPEDVPALTKLLLDLRAPVRRDRGERRVRSFPAPCSHIVLRPNSPAPPRPYLAPAPYP